MRIATRLVLILGGTVVLIMAAYMLISHRQRQALLSEAMMRDTEIFGRSLRVVANNALRNERFADLDEVLNTVVLDEEVFASVVLGPTGEVIAGGAVDLTCLRRYLPETVVTAGEGQGWADCGQRVFWVTQPLRPPAAALVVAQREVLLNRSVAAALRRQALLALVLTAAIATAIVLILHRTLAPALAEMRRGIRALGEPGERPRIEVKKSAGELAELAEAFNRMAEQLDQKHREVLDQAEERVALERRLRDAEKFAVIGRLSGGIAHELGSPLSVIAIHAEAMRTAPDTPAPARKSAETIAAQIRRITEFIQGLLQIERRQGIVYEPLELTQTLEELLAEIATRAAADDIELDIELPSDPVMVRGEKTMLRHALRNLVRNSIHALEGHDGERCVRVRVETNEYEVRVLVEDTGPGISPENLEQVFDPFFTTKAVGKGMGLGLPITRAIIEEHGGELHLENLHAAGLRAVLVLPVAAGNGRGSVRDGEPQVGAETEPRAGR